MLGDGLRTSLPDDAGAASRRLDYEVVDVFTAQAFAGNPLAIVYAAHDLSTEQMLAIATEFNLSETVFPVPLSADDVAAGASYRVRIFTPGGEIPFAGHPTLGTAWALRERGAISGGEVRQACGAGLIVVSMPADRSEPVELAAKPRDEARELSADEVALMAPLVGLQVSDVAGPAYLAGCGLTWAYLQVNPEALVRARASSVRLAEVALDQSGLIDPLDGVDVFALDPGSPDRDGNLQIFSRVFVPGLGISEDPATGSAAVGLGLALVAAGLAAPEGQTAYRIEQGVEMGRPSVLAGRVVAAEGAATMAYVAGHVVPIAVGTIAVPPARS